MKGKSNRTEETAKKFFYVLPESVSMKAATSGMPGSIAAGEVSYLLLRVNFAAIIITEGEAETEAFKASEGLNAHGFR
jgi:hypothetical protein